MEMRSCIGARQTTIAKTGCGNNRSGCRCTCTWDTQPHGDRASTSRMGGRICIRAGPASMPETAYRHNCAQDADAIAHGMRNQMEAKPLGCTTALHGAGQTLCQQQVLDTTVRRMQMQLRSDEQPCGGRANTYRMEMCSCIRANNYTKKGL